MTELTRTEEQRLRVALGMIGEVAAEEESGTGTSPRPTRKRPRGSPAVPAAVAALCFGLLVFGRVRGDADTSRSEGSRSLNRSEWIACSPMIVEGDVVATAGVPGRSTLVEITLAVRKWIKPEHGATEQVGFTALAAGPEGSGDLPYRSGERMLVVVSHRPDMPSDVFRVDGGGTSRTLEFGRGLVDRNLAAAERTECPGFWRDRGDGRSSGRGDT